jgi:hypothetical protein
VPLGLPLVGTFDELVFEWMALGADALPRLISAYARDRATASDVDAVTRFFGSTSPAVAEESNLDDSETVLGPGEPAPPSRVSRAELAEISGAGTLGVSLTGLPLDADILGLINEAVDRASPRAALHGFEALEPGLYDRLPQPIVVARVRRIAAGTLDELLALAAPLSSLAPLVLQATSVLTGLISNAMWAFGSARWRHLGGRVEVTDERALASPAPPDIARSLRPVLSALSQDPRKTVTFELTQFGPDGKPLATFRWHSSD